MNETKYTIAIESGIGGGSVSIFDDEKILVKCINCEPAGKSDNLIEQISSLLQIACVNKKDIVTVKYSECPGSYTGLKIGASVAKGLKISLNADIEGRDLFESIYKKYSTSLEGNSLFVLPQNRSGFIWRIYNKEGKVLDSGQSQSGEMNPYKFQFGIKNNLKIFLPVSLFKNIDHIYKYFELDIRNDLVDLGENLSVYLA